GFVALRDIAWEVGFRTCNTSEFFELPARLQVSQAVPPWIGWLKYPHHVDQDITFLCQFDQFVEIQFAAVVFPIGHNDQSFLRMSPPLEAVEGKGYRIKQGRFPVCIQPEDGICQLMAV